MKPLKMLSVVTVVLAVALLDLGSTLLAAEPEDLWRELAQMSKGERDKRLLLGAQKEGMVVWYVNLNVDHVNKLRAAFEKRYSGIKMEFWRGGGDKTANRLLTESRAGKFAADVVHGGNEYQTALTKAGLIGSYSSPERNAYREAFKDSAGAWTSFVTNLVVIAYNTRLVSKAEAPQSYEDFLAPQWRGNFALDTDPDHMVIGLLKRRGAEATEQFMRGLVKNDIQVRRGHTLITQLVCAGEFKAAMELYAYRVAELKHEKGCPLELVFPDPTPGGVEPLSVARRAPHPHAAALLVDFLLAEEGQRILAQNGWISGRQGIRAKYPEIDVEARGVRFLTLTPDDAERWGPDYQKIRQEMLLGRSPGPGAAPR
jgi:iron(III) transport system substrate-binding protein